MAKKRAAERGQKPSQSGGGEGPLSKKQKRVLKKKQRREEDSSDGEVPPMPEQSGGLWSFKQAHVEAGKGGKKKKGEEGLKVCPAGHPMRVFGTPHDEYMCDAASACDGGFLPQGSLLFGCRLCDWDACQKCTAKSTQERAQAALKQEEAGARAKAQARADSMKKEQRTSTWKFLRGDDKYKNEFLLMYHDKTGACAELHHYSDGQFTFQNGMDCMVCCVSTDGKIVPFQFTRMDLLGKLVKGGGKLLPEKGVEFGNYRVTPLEDGGALASMDFKFTKTTKHKDDPFKTPYTGEGLETHFTCMGDMIYLPAESVGDTGVVLEAWAEPRVTSRKEASDMLIDEEDRLEDQ